MSTAVRDPYGRAQRRLKELQAKLYCDGALRPAIDCVVEIRGFIQNWDPADGDLNDAIAVFARRQNVTCRPTKMTKALIHALVVDASRRPDQVSTEWANTLDALAKVPHQRTRQAISAEGGVDKVAKAKQISPRHAYVGRKNVSG